MEGEKRQANSQRESADLVMHRRDREREEIETQMRQRESEGEESRDGSLIILPCLFHISTCAHASHQNSSVTGKYTHTHPHTPPQTHTNADLPSLYKTPLSLNNSHFQEVPCGCVTFFSILDCTSAKVRDDS